MSEGHAAASVSLARDDFRAPERDAYARHVVDKTGKNKSSVHLGVQKVDYEREGKDALEQELYRVDKYKLGSDGETGKKLRRTNFSLGQSATDYTSEGNRAYQQVDAAHYREAAVVQNTEARRSNFALGYEASDYATTSAADVPRAAPEDFAQQRREIKAMKKSLVQSNFSIGGGKGQYTTENEARSERIMEGRPGALDAGVVQSLRASNLKLGNAKTTYDTTARQDFTEQRGKDLRYELDMSKVRNSSIPMQDRDHKQAYQSTAAAEFTEKSVARRASPQKEGGSQRTNFTLGHHATDYSTVSQLQAPEAGVSYRHENRGAAANRQASWNAGTDEGSWRTEAADSNAHVAQPKSLLEAKPDFLEMDKKRSLVKGGAPAKAKPGHVSSVYIGVATKGSWDTEAGGEYTKKAGSAAEAARERRKVEQMKQKVRQSNLQLTDHSKGAYESTSKAQLFDPARDGPAERVQRGGSGVAADGAQVFRLGMAKASFATTSGGPDTPGRGGASSRTEELMRATRDRVKEQKRINQSNRDKMRTNVYIAGGGADVDPWRTNAVASFAPPPPESYIKDEVSTKEPADMAKMKEASMDHEKMVDEKPDMSEFWKDHRPKPSGAGMRSANFTLGRDSVDYTTHAKGEFVRPDAEHYRNAGATVQVPALRASNFTLGHAKTDWQSHTHAVHRDEDDDDE